jgi:hypothetical protein
LADLFAGKPKPRFFPAIILGGYMHGAISKRNSSINLITFAGMTAAAKPNSPLKSA